MVEKEDGNLRELMKQLSDVPFRNELKARILDEAKTSSAPERLVGKRRRPWGRYFAVASGLVAACVVGGVAISQRGMHIDNTSAASKTIPFHENAKQFGLQRAPVQITNIRIGTIDGDPADSDVLADVTNTSDQPLYESEMFGVLSFTPKGQPNAAENWLTFVNGPSQVIQPGQKTVWYFHPSGKALHNPTNDRLIEQPHLQFYSSHLVATDVADTVWKRSQIKVSNPQVEPRHLANGIQSVQINVNLTNTSDHAINLNQARAVIWFASSSDQSFLSDNSIRFMYHLTPEYSDQHWPTVLQKGKSINVNFRVLSDSSSDFFSRTAHVIIIDAPDVTQ